MARTTALRAGAGIRDFAPCTDIQITSLNSMSGSVSSLLKSQAADCCAPGAFTVFLSVRSYLAGRCLNGARSALSVKLLNIGVAAASYWLIGGMPSINSIVRSIREVVHIVEST